MLCSKVTSYSGVVLAVALASLIIMFQSSSSNDYDYDYDIFLSFCGQDTRRSFTSFLHHFLTMEGVKAFKDDDSIPKGERITVSLSNAIRTSRIAILVLSQNYAYSTFCLDELALIYERYTQEMMKVFPVFYNVDPAVVRYQRESYGTAFEKHEQGRLKNEKERLEKWRTALRGVADLHGWPLKQGGGEDELELIKEITATVCGALKRWSLKGKPEESVLQHSEALTSPLSALQINSQTSFNNPVDEDINVLSMPGCEIHGVRVIGKFVQNSSCMQGMEVTERAMADKEEKERAVAPQRSHIYVNNFERQRLPDGVKQETSYGEMNDSYKEYESGYGRRSEYESGYGRRPEYESAYGTGYGGRNDESEYGTGYDRRKQESEYGSGYGNKDELEYGTGYGRRKQKLKYRSGYGRKDESEYGSEYGSGYGRKDESEYGSGYGGRKQESEYGSLYGRKYESEYGSGYAGRKYESDLDSSSDSEEMNKTVIRSNFGRRRNAFFALFGSKARS